MGCGCGGSRGRNPKAQVVAVQTPQNGRCFPGEAGFVLVQCIDPAGFDGRGKYTGLCYQFAPGEVRYIDMWDFPLGAGFRVVEWPAFSREPAEVSRANLVQAGARAENAP